MRLTVSVVTGAEPKSTPPKKQIFFETSQEILQKNTRKVKRIALSVQNNFSRALAFVFYNMYTVLNMYV